jgi:hypothetical protein
MQAAPTEPPITTADPVVGRIETDRFCDDCGFNMRTAPVFRDERTRLLLARCTECGRVHDAALLTTAGRVWLNRLGVFATIAWMFFLAWATFMLGLGEMGLQFATLDELTESSRVGRQVEADMDDYWAFMSLMLGLSAVAGFVMVTLYACAAHHWKKVYHMMLAAIVPLIPMTIAWRAWISEAPHLEQWGWQYLLAHASIQVSAGIIAALLGRTIVRGLATVLLPPRSRTLLGFLWLADGKPPPGTKE